MLASDGSGEEVLSEVIQMSEQQQGNITCTELRGWRTMDDAPRDGTSILVYTHHGNIELTNYFVTRHDDYELEESGLYRKVSKISYEGWNGNYPLLWMPLPVPPEEVAVDGHPIPYAQHPLDDDL